MLSLLGPQRTSPTLEPVLRSQGIDGPVCVITAGWQEREGELDELEQHLSRPVQDLNLYARADEVFAEDPALFEAHRARQQRLRELQRYYRMRLHHALAAAREVLAVEGEDELLAVEKAAAIAGVSVLDQEHLRRIQKLHADYRKACSPLRHAAIIRHREQLEQQIRGSAAVLIAGGHVAVLLNRLRLFGLGPVLHDRALVAWSAGAMVLGEQIVLFHDHPPQGAGNAEVLDAGLGLLPDMVPLPDARRRLRLNDRARVALLAGRFAPAACLTLDPRALLQWHNGMLTAAEGSSRLLENGELSDPLA